MPKYTDTDSGDVLKSIFAIVVVGAMWFWLIGRAVEAGNSPEALLAYLVGVPLVFVASIIAHECGHLAAGTAARLPFIAFAFGPLRWIRWKGKYRFGFDTSNATAAFVMFQPVMDRYWRIRWGAMALAGPLTNIILAIVCLACAPSEHPLSGWIATGKPQDIRFLGIHELAWRPLLHAAAAINAFLALDSLLPARSKGMRTDGGQMLDLARGTMPVSTEKGFAEKWLSFRTAKPAIAIGIGIDWNEEAGRTFSGMYEESKQLGDDHLGSRHLLLAAVDALPPAQYEECGFDANALRKAIFAH
jgi:Zn-dependent protease